MNIWAHFVGVSGEKFQLHTKEGSEKVKWTLMSNVYPSLTWYKTYFDTPEGNNTSHVALRMNNMSKGMVWVNGRSIGHY